MEHEATIRLVVFMGLFALFAALEALAPRRVRSQPRSTRWVTNWSITVLNTLTLRAMAFALPLLAVGAAIDARAQDWGLFNMLFWPDWIEIILSILILDFAIWLQHLITHKIPILWRLHRVHHADVDIDAPGENEDDYHVLQLVGCRAFLIDGDEFGIVSDVLNLPGQDVLVIKTESGESLIPFVHQLVPVVDIKKKTMTVIPPEIAGSI